MAERRSRGGGLRGWLAGGLVALTVAGCHPMDNLIVAIFGRSMRDQPSIGTYEDPRLPAEGSVPFAAGNFASEPGTVQLGQAEGGAVPAPVTPVQLLQEAPAVMGLENPVPPTAASLERGAEVYLRACVPCHGATGDGQGPVTQAGVPPFSIVQDRTRELPDGYLYTIIRIGRGAMPAYAYQITHFDRWHVVNYVRQLQDGLPQGAQGSGSAGQDH